MSFESGDSLIQATINYYAWVGYWQHVRTQAKHGLKRLGNDPNMHFWISVCDIFEGKRSEGITGLEKIKPRSEVTLPCLLAMVHAHKLADMVDKDAVKALEGEIKNEVKSAGEAALVLAATFMWVSGKHDKARDLVDRAIKMNTSNKEALTIRAWIELTCGRDAHVQKAAKYFAEALKGAEDSPDSFPPLAGVGKAIYLLKHENDAAKAIDALNKTIVRGTFLPGMIEKSKALISMGDWDAAVEEADRCLGHDSSCLPALLVKIVFSLVRTGQRSEATKTIKDLMAALADKEKDNAHCFFEAAELPSLLSGGDAVLLKDLRKLINRALTLKPNNAQYIVEFANQLFMQGQHLDALKHYRKAMDQDESSISALTGAIECQLMEGMVDDARQQLEFLKEIQSSLKGGKARLQYLSALLLHKESASPEKVLKELDVAFEEHEKTVKATALSLDYYKVLDPWFVARMAELYLEYCPAIPALGDDAATPVLSQTVRLLELVTKPAPGQLNGVYLLARAKLLSGNLEEAFSGAQYCVRQEPGHSHASILLAQIHLAQNSPSGASQALQAGLSQNFEIRDLPAYHIVQAEVLKAEGKVTEAIKSVMTALKMPGVRRKAIKVQGNKSKQAPQVPNHVRAHAFTLMALLQVKAQRHDEAKKVIQEALGEFTPTTEHGRIVLTQAEMLLEQGGTEAAIQALREVPTFSIYYVLAKRKMADIYLRYRKDKQMYAACHKELLDHLPPGHAHLLLGDAYMNIQEPSKAIEVYQAALKQNPKDAALATKIGAAMVKTHDFHKAIGYYEAAVKSGQQPHLRQDLARLYLRLQEYDKAAQTVTAALEHEPSTELDVMLSDVRYLVLLGDIHTQADRPAEALQSLDRARQLQANVLSRVAVEQPEALKQHQQLAADICMKIAAYHEEGNNASQAVNFFREALKFDESNTKAMLAVAKLYLRQGDIEAAQFQLTSLLRHDKDNADGTLLMADVMFRKYEYDSAIFHFQQLLDRDPTNYRGLSRLVDLLRRTGNLDQCPKFIKAATAACPRPDTEPGLNYCRALYKRFTHQPNEALRLFNLARKDAEWGVSALYHMVEICLNPTADILGSEIEASSEPSEEMARTAGRLLDELRNNGQSNQTRFKLLGSYALLTNKSKQSIDKALQIFMGLAAEGQADSVGAILGLGRAYMLQKNTPKARNQLKRVAKAQWTMEDAEDLEGAWLLLADIHISSGKYDLAEELLKRILQHNKSCSKAWEYMGFIKEKEQSYANAAEHYEFAWKHTTASNSAVGYKLAFNYLKAKRFIEAIDICHEVLKHNPNYPRIRRDILDKARQGIRM